jgi:hypothetical protein
MDTNLIIVDINKSNDLLSIYDKNKVLLGEITPISIIQYISQPVYPTLFENLQRSDSKFNSNLVGKYICSITVDQREIKIEMLSHAESPLMGDVEKLMKIYKALHKFEKESLENELCKIPSDGTKKKISGLIEQFKYLFLSHILKLIATISDAIKNDNSKKELKEMLLKYSVACSYNMSNFMKNKIEEKIIDIEILKSDVIRMGNVKIEMYKKVDELTKSVIKQNIQIQDITKKLDSVQSVQNSSYKTDEEYNDDTSSNILKNNENNNKDSSQNGGKNKISRHNYKFNDKDFYFTGSESDSDKDKLNKSGKSSSNHINYLTLTSTKSPR